MIGISSFILAFLITVHLRHFMTIFVLHVKGYNILDLRILQSQQKIEKNVDQGGHYHQRKSYSCAL